MLTLFRQRRQARSNRERIDVLQPAPGSLLPPQGTGVKGPVGEELVAVGIIPPAEVLS